MYVAMKIKCDGSTPENISCILITKDLDMARKSLVVVGGQIIDHSDYGMIIENGDFIRIISTELYDFGFSLNSSTKYILCVTDAFNVDNVHYDDNKISSSKES